jgi:restriction system protein
MPIPGYHEIMLPLLMYAGDGNEHKLRDAIEHISASFNLSEIDRQELLPSGRQSVIDNRVGWARTYLKKAGLLVYPRRGIFRITERGKKVLDRNPTEITNEFLEQFPEFLEFRKSEKSNEETKTREILTPREVLEKSYQSIRDDLKSELADQLNEVSPQFFERLVVELLVKMGYGGSLKDAGQAVGKSGDEGIDGVIKEDKLGLDNIYIQAKKWGSSVGSREVRDFVGALQATKARKGIMITTSHFTRDAIEYVSKIDTKVVLMNGDSLLDFMIDYNLGVTPREQYELKEIDLDYFTE